MNHSYFKIKMILFVTVLSCVTLYAPPLNAQIGPLSNSLGIYGSAPGPLVSDCGEARYATLQNYPEVEGGLNYTLPLNGLGNFNFYYTPDGLGFLPGGGYKITYTNSGGTNCYPTDLVINPPYSPNIGHTNGREVRNHEGYLPFRGMHGIVRGTYAGEQEIVPLKNAVVTAIPVLTPNPIATYARTNGNGYFSVYYKNGNPDQFLPINSAFGYQRYRFIISGNHMGCTYSWISPGFDVWAPLNTTNPSLESYFTDGAETVIPVPLLPLDCLVEE